MKIISLFDGMACGAIAFRGLNIPIERYCAYEIDKHAIKLAATNFPEIEHRGDVFGADFSSFEGFDYLMGGSPCTYWSIAQSPDKRETTSSGIGWELFSQYVRALNEAKPKFFIYENNKSMSAEIRRSISEAFGFEPILINSALVSAQNRNRLYWVGKRNAQEGYDKVEIEQPEDRGILLKDNLDGSQTPRAKALCLNHNAGCTRDYFEKSQNNVVFDAVTKSSININPCGRGMNGEVITTERKSRCVTTNKGEGAKIIIPEPAIVGLLDNDRIGGISAYPDGSFRPHRGDAKSTGISELGKIHTPEQKNYTLTTTHSPTIVEPEPTCVAQRGRYSDTGNRHSKSEGEIEQHFEARADGKTNTLTCVQKDNSIAEPLKAERVGDLPSAEGHISGSQANRVYSESAKSVNLVANGGGGGAKTGLYAISHTSHGFNKGGVRVQDKANTSDYANNHRLVEPCEPPKVCTSTEEYENLLPSNANEEYRVELKATHPHFGKIYEVKNGQITIEIKGEPRTYPIKLADGFYIIRKLTVAECARLQTVPEWYDFSAISNTQAYKCLGNG